MKAYKGFDKEMKCRGFQYEEGKTYETDEAKLCEGGFHACEAPLDCFKYYEPGKSVYHEVELDATEETGYDSKRVGKRITIGAKLDVAGIVKAQFAYTKERCTNSEMGGYGSALRGGVGSALQGGNGSALQGGDWSALQGGYGSALQGGYGSALRGGVGSALQGGNGSALQGGDGSALRGGDWSVLRGGIGSEFKGGMWSIFACEVRDDDYKLIDMKTAVVDGNTIKPDTWYTLRDGEFVEVTEDD
jgi:hypothetical protein